MHDNYFFNVIVIYNEIKFYKKIRAFWSKKNSDYFPGINIFVEYNYETDFTPKNVKNELCSCGTLEQKTK